MFYCFHIGLEGEPPKKENKNMPLLSVTSLPKKRKKILEYWLE
jgi:hypothetical protein